MAKEGLLTLYQTVDEIVSIELFAGIANAAEEVEGDEENELVEEQE